MDMDPGIQMPVSSIAVVNSKNMIYLWLFVKVFDFDFDNNNISILNGTQKQMRTILQS